MKVFCRLFGGIGNQLFMYSAARRLAIKNRAEVHLDTKTGFESDYEYRRQYQLHHFSISATEASPIERLEPFAKPRRFIKRTLSKLLPFGYCNFICQKGSEFDKKLLNLNLRNDVWLEGYWQSEDYFKDVEAIIRDDLKIIPPCDAKNTEFAKLIKSKMSVAVHVRFFDQPGDLTKNDLSKTYYQNAIALMEKNFPDVHYFIFSNKPLEVLNEITFPLNRSTIVSHNYGDENAYADLWLMSLCNHFIIANSTFSWWGAWLSEYPAKIVIAPSVIINSGRMAWGFEGLLPNNWIKV
jgi:hypothetical protein